MNKVYVVYFQNTEDNNSFETVGLKYIVHKPDATLAIFSNRQDALNLKAQFIEDMKFRPELIYCMEEVEI